MQGIRFGAVAAVVSLSREKRGCIMRGVYLLAVVFITVAAFSCRDCAINGHPIWFVGEMTVTPDQIPADGQSAVEIVVWVFEGAGDVREAMPNIRVEVQSSRNQGGNVLDTIEQPTGNTDADGRAVAYLWSSTPGEAQLRAITNGAVLCKTREGSSCVEELQVMVTFVE